MTPDFGTLILGSITLLLTLIPSCQGYAQNESVDARPSMVWIVANEKSLREAHELVPGGHDSKGTPTFICRCVDCHGKNVIPGWVNKLPNIS